MMIVETLLGFNRNQGELIALRLRFEDGFRTYESIKAVLFHELAHNRWSEHDHNFHAFNRQLTAEAKQFDWTQSQGMTSLPLAFSLISDNSMNVTFSILIHIIIVYRAHNWRSSNIPSIRWSKLCPRTVSIKRSYLRRALRRCAQSGKSCKNGIRSRCTETIGSRARDCGLVWGCSSRQWRKNEEQRNNSKTRRRWYHRNRRKKAQAKH